MTSIAPPAGARAPALVATLARLNSLGDRLPHGFVAIAARLFPAVVFWQSGRTKVEGFRIADSTWFLFDQVYALPLIPSAWAAVMATVAEHLFPILLVLGLFTRLSALALLAMTAVIQVFVFPDAWLTHGLWAVCFLVLIARGPGVLSLDRAAGLDR